ncbi:MAG TPA: histidine kinase [Pyrinomonadaceae bacterium]|nr:histidine kinase [Pyrinomonadaceae bacterium]
MAGRGVGEAGIAKAGRAHAPYVPVDDRMICLVRLVLAASALLIIYIDPSQPNRLVRPTYAALALYALYSAALYAASLRTGAHPFARAAHWIDVGCYLVLVSLSSGTSSVFFFFFFFPVLIASFGRGFAAGLRAAVVSAVLFTAVGYATAPRGEGFELNRFLLRPVYLLALGYMMAYWGGAEIRLKRRLALLKEVNALANPRFGVGHTAVSIMRRVRAFYDADACLLLLRGAGSEDGEFQLSRVARPEAAAVRAGGDAEDEVAVEGVPAELAAQFMTLPETLAVVFNVRTWPWQPRDACYFAFDLATDERADAGRRESEALAALLDAEAFASVPLLHRGRAAGRLFLAGPRGAFEPADVDFVRQIVEHVMPVLENVRLLERLAAKAAETERQRIARDLHDSVIQPYIGLQYKLAAVRGKLDAGARTEEVSEDIRRLFDVTVSEIAGLRRYVSGLKGGAGAGDLAAAVLRYTEQFQENYGIDVKVTFRGEAGVPERLAAEVIQMVHEGLRNVWKHTAASRCAVALDASAERLLLSIENDNAEGEEGNADFTPRSITERAEALGGRATVACDGRGHTVLVVRVPL